MALDTAIAKMLGLDQAAVAQGQNTLQGLGSDIACIRDEITALATLVSYRLGKAKQTAEGYDPAALPGIYQQDVGIGATEPIDLRALIGKSASYGWIKNIGTVDLELVYVKANQGSDGTTKSNAYLLEAGEKIPIDGIIDELELTNPDTAVNAGKAQVYAR